MKKLIALAVAVAFAGSAYAGCPKVEVKGKLSAYDAEKKELTISQKDKDDQTVTLAADAKVKDAKGEEAKIEDLVGKRISLKKDKHSGKSDEISAMAKKEKKDKKAA